jgi:hypothetical protein
VPGDLVVLVSAAGGAIGAAAISSRAASVIARRRADAERKQLTRKFEHDRELSDRKFAHRQQILNDQHERDDRVRLQELASRLTYALDHLLMAFSGDTRARDVKARFLEVQHDLMSVWTCASPDLKDTCMCFSHYLTYLYESAEAEPLSDEVKSELYERVSPLLHALRREIYPRDATT